MNHQSKESFKVLALALILFSSIWMFSIQASHASNTLIVPQDYPTITAAVNHASPGDVIAVNQGIYYENIQINKSLSLLGENSGNTIIIGSGGPNAPAVLTLAAAGIKVSGFTIESDNNSVPTLNAWGINIQGDNCAVTGNIIKNNYIGIFCALQSSTTITDNTITLSIKDGIRFYSGTLNNISDNNIIANAVSGLALGGYANVVSHNNLQNNQRGLGLGASNSVVFDNTIVSNVESGIFLSGSKNVISANGISTNKYGIYITTQGAAPRGNEIYQNNFVNNLNNAYGNSSFLIESWDNGSSGNFWSDYQSTPYMVNSNNLDNYPLTSPFNTSNPGKTPLAISPALGSLNGIVASWTFDNVTSGGVIPDVTGNNPAVLASTVGNKSFTPAQGQGKFGSALNFDGAAYAFVPPSASLQTPQELTIDAWVNVQQIKDVAYNNILVECVRTTLPLPTRTVGVAINGETPQNSSSPPLAAIRGYVTTQKGILNEIDTKEPIPLNQWIHVVFTRSLTSGMHIYVNDQEQAVTVSSGEANPTGPIAAQNELYIGHDSITEIDQLQISNTVESDTQPFWMQWWIWPVIVFAAVAGVGLIVYFKKSNSKKVKNGLMVNP